MKNKNTSLFFAGLICFAILGAGSAEDSGETESASYNLENAEYTVNYKSLADEFESNSVAAENRYEGRVIHVQGPIYSIDKDFTGSPYITLSGAYDLAIIRCEIGNNSAGIEELRKGQLVTIGGVVGDTTMGVSLDPCKVISVNTSNALPTPPSEFERLQQEINAEARRAEQELNAAAQEFEREVNAAMSETP